MGVRVRAGGTGAPGGGGGLTVLKARGVDVNGGGSGPPFSSPFTLRFSGGSEGGAPPLSFFFPCFPPFPCEPDALSIFASCSSNVASHAGSIRHT